MNYFSDDELSCLCCGENHMNQDFMKKMNAFRAFLGFPFPVSSAYRCPKHNNEVSHTGLDGPHTTGQAIDIKCSHKQAFDIVTNARNFGFTGIGINQKGKARFIHLDTLDNEEDRPRPHIWSY